jgi:hypothetical protein
VGGRPRDEDVKDEPDEDEAAMLGEGSSKGLQSPEAAIRGLARGWRRSYHGTGHATRRRGWQPGRAYESCHGLRTGASEQPAVAMPWLRGLEREMLGARGRLELGGWRRFGG